jgi:hypothetical protein
MTIKPSGTGCIFHNKLPNNIKLIGNNIHCKKDLKDLLSKGSYYSIEDYLNEEFSNVNYW